MIKTSPLCCRGSRATPTNSVQMREHKVWTVKFRMGPKHYNPTTLGGPSAPLLSFIGAINFLRNGKQLLIDGYQRVSVLSSTPRLCC